MKFYFNDWRDYFEDIGIPQGLVDIYLLYIRQLLNSRNPVIFEFNHLALLLGRTNHYLASVINSPENHYRLFELPKKRGGYREIAAPFPALLDCQRWINKKLLSKVKIHDAAHGFTSKRSIISNAKIHLGRKTLLKLDLKDFFPSIEMPQVIRVFRNLGYPPNIAFYLSRLCCLEERLPQGAATSPPLSNIIAKPLDIRLHKLGKTCGLSYTRYADDMTFSGEKIGSKFISYVNKIVIDSGFQLNKKKTILSRSSGRRIVTGLSVRGEKLKIPRSYKRKLRQEVHHILKYGYISHSSKKKIRDPFHHYSIYGKMTYWQKIEPENKFVRNNIGRLRELLVL